MKLILLTVLQGWLFLTTSAFAPARSSVTKQSSLLSQQPTRYSRSPLASSLNNDNNDSNGAGPWNPELRKIMAGVASLGAIETAYLTATKLSGDSVLCTVQGSCNDVLNGPYSFIPFTDHIPLSALGCLAYALTALVAIMPVLVDDSDDDVNNRMALLVLTTGLGTFSTFLMTLLATVLHQSCLYCLSSASLSWTLAATAWFGGVLPPAEEHRVAALQSSAYSFLATTVSSVILFASVDAAPSNAAESLLEPQAPPAITTTSSPQAIAIGKELSKYNAQMYGAFWCSHCYDQKQALGKQVFSYDTAKNAAGTVPYIECSKDGVNSQYDLCKEKNVPGYPTWEINGKLYPGEQELEELQEIVDTIKSGK